MIEHQKWALLSFKGRMCRRDYWLHGIPVMLLVAPILFYKGGNTLLDILSFVISLFATYASIALNIKRLQDRDRSLWWIVFIWLPIVGSIYVLIDLGILDGTPGDNRYGPDPKGRHSQAKNEGDKETFEA